MKRHQATPGLALFFCLALAPLTGVTGCSSHHSETRTVETDTGPSGDARGQYRHEEVRTIEHEDHGSDECGGVLSCAVDVVGEIIAFPFKAVGSLFGAIF